MNIKPLPCPFCGSALITIEWEPCPPLDATDTTRRWFAECSQCSCQGPFCQKEPQVIPAWNRRAPSSEAEQAKADRNRIAAQVRSELLPKTERLRKALEGLVNRLEFIHNDEAFKSVWMINQIHCGPYTGPTYVDALTQAKEALKA